jgi:peptide/nickel transport system permease protein
MRRAGALVVLLWIVAAALAGVVSPNGPTTQFADSSNAPPMRMRLIDADGRWRAPFVYPLRLVDRIESRYEVEWSRPVPLVWFSGGRLLQTADAATPLLLLGADAIGRDVFARLLHGARLSLGVALLAGTLALIAGALLGAAAGYAGGWIDDAVMRVADFLIILPTIYVVLALRAVMPLVLEPWQVFWLLAALLALVGWPYVARPVRAIVATEARREYVEAARAVGAGPARIIGRHLTPASAPALATQATLLLPAFVLAEATLSFVGLGFAEPAASWGAMLSESRNVRAMSEFPWLLAPAAAIVLFVLGLHLAFGPEAGVRTLLRTRKNQIST